MLRLAKARKELSVINDQVGAPTGAELLADCTAHAIRVAMVKPDVLVFIIWSRLKRRHGTTMQRWYSMKPERRVSNWQLKNSMPFQQLPILRLHVVRRIRA